MEKQPNEETTVKLSKSAMKSLETKARPFESKRDCLERVIVQSCSPKNKKMSEESDVENGEK